MFYGKEKHNAKVRLFNQTRDTDLSNLENNPGMDLTKGRKPRLALRYSYFSTRSLKMSEILEVLQVILLAYIALLLTKGGENE